MGAGAHTTAVDRLQGTDMPALVQLGGVALYIRSTLPHRPLRSLTFLSPAEAIFAQETLGQQSILVGSCYLPPPATVPPGLFLPCVAHGLPCIIGGDFNGHHVWWSSGNPNEAGDQLQEAVDQAGFEIAGLEVNVPLATFQAPEAAQICKSILELPSAERQ